MSVVKIILLDIVFFIRDIDYYYIGVINRFSSKHFYNNMWILICQFNDFRKYFLKKYCYTINHKRIAINYFIFSMWSSLSGAALATMIRLELAYPGSQFFKGDSLKYLQVITAITTQAGWPF